MFESVFCEMAATLSRPQCVKTTDFKSLPHLRAIIEVYNLKVNMNISDFDLAFWLPDIYETISDIKKTPMVKYIEIIMTTYNNIYFQYN